MKTIQLLTNDNGEWFLVDSESGSRTDVAHSQADAEDMLTDFTRTLATRVPSRVVATFQLTIQDA